MSNMDISNRANKALDILADGGEFIYRLERNGYAGREQFRASLLDAAKNRVSGFGGSVLDELNRKGLLIISNRTTVGTRYKINRAA